MTASSINSATTAQQETPSPYSSYMEALTAPVSRAILLERAVKDAKKIWNDKPEAVETSKSGLWRLLSASMAVLNHTHAELDRAKNLLLDYETRIELLEQIATTDELTGLKNRRGFTMSFNQELDRVQRGLSKGGVLVLIDLDNFKAINDTHGHQAGDECLKAVGDVLLNTIRLMDSACRLGGDEFVLLLADADKEKALERIQNLAWALNHLTVEYMGAEIPVCASVGIKNYGRGESAEDIFKQADEALYTNKAIQKEEA